MCCVLFFFFFKQKTAYEMRISDWSSDVCSSDLDGLLLHQRTDRAVDLLGHLRGGGKAARARDQLEVGGLQLEVDRAAGEAGLFEAAGHLLAERPELRSEEHTSELQSLMRISYAVFCLKKKIIQIRNIIT